MILSLSVEINQGANVPRQSRAPCAKTGSAFLATFFLQLSLVAHLYVVTKLAARRGLRNLNPVGAAQIREGLES